MRLTSSDIQLSMHTNTKRRRLWQGSSTRRRGPTSGQEMLVLPSQRPTLGRCRPQSFGTPCFIVLVKFWHRLRALHVHIRCFQAVARTRRHVDNTTVQNTDLSLTLENFGLVDRIESTKKRFNPNEC